MPLFVPVVRYRGAIEIDADPVSLFEREGDRLERVIEADIHEQRAALKVRRLSER